LSRDAARDRILAGASVPPARPHCVHARCSRRRLDQDAALPVKHPMATSAHNQPRRTLLLTGASRGIGHATVKKFSAGGWRVITVSRQPFSALCPWPGGAKNHVQIDLAEPDDVQRGIEEIRDRLGGGRLDALVNNAAISPKDETGGRFGAIDTPFDLWRRVFNVNFFAPVALARGLMRELSEARGCVVNVTSIAGSRVHPFAGSAYATSKAALAALTREM